jgi:hypothetical protein
MILRTVTGALVALLIAASPALACMGEEIYSDDFAEDSGNWANADWIKIGGGALEMALQPQYSGWLSFRGGTFKEFDVCVDITNGAADGAGGLIFWQKDADNRYMLVALGNGVVGLARVTKGRLLFASPPRQNPAVKGGPGTKNTFRVTVKGNSITGYGNGQKLFATKGVPEDGYIGFYAEAGAGTPNWKFSNFKLTDAPKE